jgi:hypothetical protein
VVALDASNVPESLHPYIPYAQFWGISDDLDRELFVSTAPSHVRMDLVAIAKSIDDELDKWLAGPEAYSPNPTREYVAFSCFRMAADYA